MNPDDLQRPFSPDRWILAAGVWAVITILGMVGFFDSGHENAVVSGAGLLTLACVVGHFGERIARAIESHDDQTDNSDDDPENNHG